MPDDISTKAQVLAAIRKLEERVGTLETEVKELKEKKAKSDDEDEDWP